MRDQRADRVAQEPLLPRRDVAAKIGLGDTGVGSYRQHAASCIGQESIELERLVLDHRIVVRGIDELAEHRRRGQCEPGEMVRPSLPIQDVHLITRNWPTSV